jgi:hypothetical protein
MNSNRVQRRSANRKKSSEKAKTVLWSSILSVLVLVICGAFIFFQSHFLPITQINNLSVGWLSVEAAEEKLAQLNETNAVIIQMGDREEKLELPQQYEISKDFLKENLHKGTVNVPVNSAFTEELKKKIAAINFPEGTPGKNAEVQWVDTAYVIVPEEVGTVVDKERLSNQIISDVEQGKGNYTYNIADFYQLPEITKVNAELQASLAKLNSQVDKTITLTVGTEKVVLARDELRALLDENGKPISEQVTAWVTQLDATHGSANQPVQFTDVHGNTRKYTNNGQYGWSIDIAKTSELLIQAIASDQKSEAITVPIIGDNTQAAKIANNYIEIDLNDQKMYCFIDGKKVVETDVITGRYNKGTATVPGFHTILYKTTNVNLEGQMLDGTEYSVPVKYWMPLISAGGVVTQIGIHDSDHKLERFGDKEAYKTLAGSNGCINTPGTEVAKIFEVAYPGMPVIIYGHIYDDAPGEFDKPVDYGEPV